MSSIVFLLYCLSHPPFPYRQTSQSWLMLCGNPSMNHNRNQAKMFNMFLMVAHYSIAYQGSIYDDPYIHIYPYMIVAIPLPEFIVRPERPRPGHPHQYQTIYCRTDAYKYSFFPFTIKQWNALPTSTACQSTLPLFQGDLLSLSP